MTKSKKPDDLSPIIRQYKQGVSAARLGQQYGVSGDTIVSWLRKAGVYTRTPKEAAQHPEKRRLVSDSKKGKKAWNKGLTKQDPRVEKYARCLAGQKVSEETKLKISKSKCKHPWFQFCESCGRKKGFNRRNWCVFCAAQYRINTFPPSTTGAKLSEEHKKKLVGSNLKKRLPARSELKTLEKLNFIFGGCNPYKFTGSGQDLFFIRINNSRLRVPDFTSFHHKKVIEIFGTYWHPPEEENQAIAEYASVGWGCLVIWENEWEGFYDRVMSFTHPVDYFETIQDTCRFDLGVN